MFTAVMAVLGGLAALVCHTVAGAPGVEAVVWAFALCVVPGWVVLVAERMVRSPKHLLMLVLIGTGVRMAIVLAGALVLLAVRSGLPREPFLCSLLVFYLVSLAWETKALSRALPAPSAASNGSAS